MDSAIPFHPTLSYPGLALLGRNVLHLDGREVPLLSGEVQFFRMDPPAWEPALSQVRSFGLPVVSTYLSWRRFSLGPGRYDLTGQTDPRLDLPRFLDLCRRFDLWVTFKPGPWICAEETNGGYPDWLVQEPDLQVLDANDRPVAGYMGPFVSPIPSYLHPAYQSAVRGWLQAVDEVVRPYLYPHGPVVLVQLDNEPGYTFHDRMFESDYNPANLALYPRWLVAKYGSLAAVRVAHHQAYPNLEAVRPPRRLDLAGLADLPLYLDWVEFKEWVLARHVASIGEMHLENGLDTALFTINLNEHPQLSVPNPWQKLEQASGLAGYDYYPPLPMQPPDFGRVAQAVNYSRRVLRSAWSPEIMCGIWNFQGSENGPNHLQAADFAYLYFTCLAFGLKGMNFYMLADRDNWVNSPLTDRGQPAESAAAVQAVMRFFQAVPGFPAMDRTQPVGVLHYRPYARQAFAAGSQPLEVDGRSLSEPDAIFAQAYASLLFANLDPAVCDLDSGPDALQGLRLLVAPGGAWMDRPSQARLRDWVAAGGTLIFLPAPPALDEGFAPAALFPAGSGALGAGQVISLAPGDLLAALPLVLDALGLQPTVQVEPASVLTTVQSGPQGELLFVLNPTGQPQSACLEWRCQPPARLVDVLSPETQVPVESGAARLSIPARTVQVYWLYR